MRTKNTLFWSLLFLLCTNFIHAQQITFRENSPTQITIGQDEANYRLTLEAPEDGTLLKTERIVKY